MGWSGRKVRHDPAPVAGELTTCRRPMRVHARPTSAPSPRPSPRLVDAHACDRRRAVPRGGSGHAGRGRRPERVARGVPVRRAKPLARDERNAERVAVTVRIGPDADGLADTDADQAPADRRRSGPTHRLDIAERRELRRRDESRARPGDHHADRGDGTVDVHGRHPGQHRRIGLVVGGVGERDRHQRMLDHDAERHRHGDRHRRPNGERGGDA